MVLFGYSQLRFFPIWLVVIVEEMAKPDLHTIHIHNFADLMHWLPFALLFLSTYRVSLLKAHNQGRGFFWVVCYPSYCVQSCVVHQQEIGKLEDVCAQTGKSLGNLEVTVLASSPWQEHPVLRSHWNHSKSSQNGCHFLSWVFSVPSRHLPLKANVLMHLWKCLQFFLVRGTISWDLDLMGHAAVSWLFWQMLPPSDTDTEPSATVGRLCRWPVEESLPF